MEERFYHCDTCDNLLFATIASGVAPYCCGEEMTLLQPNQTEGNGEKHMPIVEPMAGNSIRVKVGSLPHPMTAEHCIRFVCVVTDICVIIRYLYANCAADVVINCCGTPQAVYAYCNIHGLWRKDLVP